MSKGIEKKFNLIECKVDQSRILDRNVNIVKYVGSADNYNAVRKIVAWGETPGIWLSIYIGVGSMEIFLVAEGLLNNLVQIK